MSQCEDCSNKPVDQFIEHKPCRQCEDKARKKGLINLGELFSKEDLEFMVKQGMIPADKKVK